MIATTINNSIYEKPFWRRIVDSSAISVAPKSPIFNYQSCNRYETEVRRPSSKKTSEELAQKTKSIGCCHPMLPACTLPQVLAKLTAYCRGAKLPQPPEPYVVSFEEAGFS